MLRRKRYYLFSYIFAEKAFEPTGVAAASITSDIGAISVVDAIHAVEARFEGKAEVIPLFFEEITWRQREQWERLHGIRFDESGKGPRHVSIERVSLNQDKLKS